MRGRLRRISAVARDAAQSLTPLRVRERQLARLADPEHSRPEPYIPVIPRGLANLLPQRRGRVGRVLNSWEMRRFTAQHPVAREGDPASVSLVRIEGQLRLVEIRAGAIGPDVVRDNRNFVVALCERHDIDYFVVPEVTARRSRLGIPASEWARFVDVLAETAREQPFYLGVAARHPTGPVRRWPGFASRPDVLQAARTQREVEVFRMVAPDPGGRVFTRPFACLVERWEENEHGGLQAPTHNERATYVSGAHRRSVRRYTDGADVRTLAAFTERTMFEIDFPIDLVYMWVNGADPDWQLRKLAALEYAGMETQLLHGAADERFRDNGELRYSLRSVEQFAPWARKIFLVTDEQVPSWLDTRHPKIQVVDHLEIFQDKGKLPTFNSHAIGARLHHIEGLSEHYVHFNDDTMLGRRVHPQLFFQSNGVSKFFLSRSTLGFHGRGEAAPHEQARRNAAELLNRDFRRLPSRAFFHTPIPQRRSVLLELEARYPAEFATTWNSQFRSHDDVEINSWLHHYYGYLTGRAAPGNIRYDYFSASSAAAWRRMRRLRRARDVDVYCVNDSADATADQHVRIGDWLKSYFPWPASYERTT